MSDLPRCGRCRRPGARCLCPRFAAIPPPLPVVFLQHHREARRRLGTCRLAHLQLPGSELHVAWRFDAHPRVATLAAAGAALLFPGPDAQPVAATAPRLLVVVDGTWSEAGKLVRQTPALAVLPRIGLAPPAPGRYRIRRAPAAHCLSTVEAVVDVLGILAGDPDRYLPLLAPFDALVEEQLAAAAGRHPWTHERRKARRHAATAAAAG
ncbi:MAG: DTW domain-containing protein [bacterium]|nr:DTW domain-containing protein [bacterium]